jgi:hypothetical protein
MKSLKHCRAYGIATRLTGAWAIGQPLTDKAKKLPMYKCKDTNSCRHRRDFGGMPYCSDNLLSEPILKKKVD